MTPERHVVVSKIYETDTLESVHLSAARRLALGTTSTHLTQKQRRCDIAVVAVDPADPAPHTWNLVRKAQEQGIQTLPRVVRVWPSVIVGRTARSPHRKILDLAQDHADYFNRDPAVLDPVALNRAMIALAPFIEGGAVHAAARAVVAALATLGLSAQKAAQDFHASVDPATRLASPSETEDAQ